MRRPLLVASDVDGTLLDPTDQVSARTRAAVHRVVSAGVPFVLVTGRPPRWVLPVVEQLGHAGPAVCANGAVLYNAATDQVSYTVTLDPAQLRDAAAVVATALPGAKLAVELPTGSAAVNGAEQFLAESGYTHPWPGADAVNAPRDVLLSRPAIKLLVRQSDANSDMMAAAVGELLRAQSGARRETRSRGQLDVTYSTGYGLIELSAPGVTKGTGLARLAGELGVASADVLALGDMPNDLSMLRWAGHGVAMANAHPTVLEAADEITARNSEDGLALVIERWF
ncbi:MAG: HAD family phosphatase [Pseudonocardiales bacterium]|nr:HAD family phosphatase [Pseudonocardiales bacterium]MBV9030895.1 HAD family phosphatase [Pseudonocardiales bacterium]